MSSPPLPLSRLQQPDVVVISTSILSMEKVLDSFPVQRLRRSTLLVDVLSVKARRVAASAGLAVVPIASQGWEWYRAAPCERL